MRAGKRRAPGGPSLGTMLGALRDMGYASAAYRLSLTGRVPTKLIHRPADLIPGDAARGNALVSGVYDFGGQVVRGSDTAGRDNRPPWHHAGAGDYWFSALHGFGWLRDLRAAGTQAAHERARFFVRDWLEEHESIDPAAWRGDLVGRRLSAWLDQAEFLLRGADPAFERSFFQSLALHARHLTRVARNVENGAPRLVACKGLIDAGICLPDAERRLALGLKLLDGVLGSQIHSDGGHVERSPSTHLTVLRHFVEIREALGEAGHAVPAALAAAIEKMAPMLRTYRHGDGGLALFNASVEEESWLIDRVLAQADAKGRPLLNAPRTGFRRIQNGRSVLVTDVGKPAPVGRWTHAGTLSFELSVGKERLVVNCGAWRGGDPTWRHALRATAAHSTLTVDDTNSTMLSDDGRAGEGPGEITVERQDQDGAAWIEARHDGYVGPFGLAHKRRLYVSPDGTDVRGEDTLMRTATKLEGGRSFAVRFHLHPSVRASAVQDGSSVLLQPPSGAGWQLRAVGGAIDLNESIYAGDGAARRRTEQVVITGPIQSETTTVKWALRRIAAKS